MTSVPAGGKTSRCWWISTDEQLLELGSEMADALRERDKLETELLAVKKDYKARIDLSVSKAGGSGSGIPFRQTV